MQGLLTAIKAEIFVFTHSRAIQLLCVIPALIAASQLVLVRSLAASSDARAALMGADNAPGGFGGGGFGSAGTIEGADAWGALVDALGTGLTLISLIVIAYAAWSFASDRDLGVVRHLLIRRVSRPALVMSKLIQAHLLALVSITLMLLVTFGSAALLWDFGPVVEDGYELIGTEEIRAELRLGLSLALIPVPAAIALGVLISVLCNSTTQALSVALGLTLGLDLFKSVLGGAADYLYASYMVSLLDESYLDDVARLVRGFSDVMIDPSVLQLNQWVPWPQMVLFVVLALVMVRHKKL
ncbi:MAG: ABC transporter permease subunit [Pseudohongiella sp.]|nr:ABC transporter permease subunit [Pseudohongiella sp.]